MSSFNVKPNRVGRPKGRKKAKVLEYVRQDDHVRRKSNLYQAQRFVRYGSEQGLILSILSLIEASEYFNEQYGDNLAFRHCMVLTLIKKYVTDNNLTVFTFDGFKAYFPHLRTLLGVAVTERKQFRGIFTDLIHMHFINTSGHAYSPTTRLRLFCSTYDRICRDKFS